MPRTRLLSSHLVAFILLLFSALGFAQENDRPNVILILADDLGFSDLQSYGSEIDTPNINQLSARGVRFSNYHTAASCAPTRAMLMTGVNSHRAGIGNMPESVPADLANQRGYRGALSENVVTIAEMLSANGYHTYMTGKWHLGKEPSQLPSARGFERALAMADTGADNWDQKPYLPIYEKANWFEDGQPTELPQDFYSSEFLVDKTIEYIDSNAASSQPFFSYLAFQAVHIPVQAPKEYTEKYADTYTEGWSALRQQRYDGAVEQGIVPANTAMVTMETTTQWEDLSVEKQRYEAKSMAVYAGMVDAMDFHLGRLMDHLRDIGEYDNTVFIFVSDNGAEPSDFMEATRDSALGWYFSWWMNQADYNEDFDTLGEAGSYNMIGPSFASAASSPLSFYKFFTGEGGMRVPLIISGVATPLAGQVSNAFTFATDLTPTILELADIETHNGSFSGRSVEPMVGKSLLSLVNGSAEFVYSPSEAVGFELGGNAALFKGDYKIVKNRAPVGDNEWHLFNIQLDPGETQDLASAQPSRLAAMIADYEDYATNNYVATMPDSYDQQTQTMRQLFLGLAARITLIVLLGLLLVIAVVVYLKRKATMAST